MTHASPRVSLVGAGPGAADLITLRGYRRLQEADLVLYDALVAPELTDAAPQARRFCVGKRADRPSFDQATIENLMVKAARRGERVVRLKCGDPFVLGRGGEEALTLAKAGIQFEIIPGVSSAIAAAGLNAIPVTHRGITSNCVIVSGHKPDAFQPLLRSLPPGSSTVVGLMALRNRRQFAQAMLEQAWDAQTPVAIAYNAGGPRARATFGVLSDLASGAIGELQDDAGTIIIGEVVQFARELNSLIQQPYLRAYA